MNSRRLAILGAGSWGSALAIHIAKKNHVTLWSHNTNQIESIKKLNENHQYLPGITFDQNIHLTSSLEDALTNASAILIAVPSTALKALLYNMKTYYNHAIPIINATKGIDHSNNIFFHILIDEILNPHSQAVLSGPSFAKEVAQGLPTAITIAAASRKNAEFFTPMLHHHNLRTYINLDLIGVQLSGAYKNIIAIATGISDGLQLGANARAALITRGLAEMSRLGIALGGKIETFLGLAGVGDLVLTSTDSQSRNYRFGLYIGSDFDSTEAQKKVIQVVEGVNTVPSIYQLGIQQMIELPIVNEIYKLLNKETTPLESISTLLHRTIKEEI